MMTKQKEKINWKSWEKCRWKKWTIWHFAFCVSEGVGLKISGEEVGQCESIDTTPRLPGDSNHVQVDDVDLIQYSKPRKTDTNSIEGYDKFNSCFLAGVLNLSCV